MKTWLTRVLMAMMAALALPIAGCTFDDVCPMPWLQIPAVILVIAIIVGWVMYRRRQM